VFGKKVENCYGLCYNGTYVLSLRDNDVVRFTEFNGLLYLDNTLCIELRR
jgi:hypothetical protein